MLIIEQRSNGQWIALGQLHPADPDGSLSHNGPAGRQIYRFGARADHSLIERSTAGADTEVGTLRLTASVGYENIARLDKTNPTFECWIKTDRMREPHRFRFRHQ